MTQSYFGPQPYRKKPVVISAWRFNGDNATDVAAWCRGKVYQSVAAIPYLIISTLEGDHRADVGDYIIQGVAGEFYPCKPEIFSATYEAVP